MDKKIDGALVSKRILEETQAKVLELEKKPHLAIILASDDKASEVYVNLKRKRAKEIGIKSSLFEFSKEQNPGDIINKVIELNLDKNVNGILVQVPFYEKFEKHHLEIINSIDPAKDVDGLTAISQGRVNQFVPKSFPTAAVEAVLESLNFCFEEDLTWRNLQSNYQSIESLKGKNVLIINNSNLIGKPLAQILGSIESTVTLANQFTRNLKELSKNADIIISATNQGNLISHEDVKEDSILIDVTSIKKDGKIIGDFILDDEMIEKCSFYTPVPGGIGPLTIACLLRNLV